MERIVKLATFVPAEMEESVRLALGKAGAGKLGKYDHCSFVTHGTGHFRPLQDTKPYIGKKGEIANVEECQIQTVCYEKDLPQVLKALREAHPYEEVAYDIIPLLNSEYAKYVPEKKR